MAIIKDFWKSLLTHERHQLSFDGINIIVEDGVFTPNPNITYSSSIIIENLPNVSGLRVADVGTGTGVLAVIAALRGAREVVATDISVKALDNAFFNVRQNQVLDKVKVVRTNLLDGVLGTFDVIFANLPILDEVWGKEEKTSSSVVQIFLADSRSMLSAQGLIYLPWASFADKASVEDIFSKSGYDFECREVMKLGFAWYLYILKLR
jgi:methylase of polypeptide subunit release factors